MQGIKTNYLSVTYITTMRALHLFKTHKTRYVFTIIYNITITNNYQIWKPYACTNILKYSFWHRYIDDWNSLPKDVVEAVNVSNFKRHLYKLLIRDSVLH